MGKLLLHTAINIPYGSMASAISTDPVERAQLSTFRSVGAALAGVIVGFVAPMIVYVKDEAENQSISWGAYILFSHLFSLYVHSSATQSVTNGLQSVLTDKNKIEKKLLQKDLVKGLVGNRALVSIYHCCGNRITSCNASYSL